MTTPTNNATFYADFKSLSALKHDAKTDGQQALRGASQQFESLFINMMLKSMRDATSSVGDSITGGHEMELYQGMFDEQIATQMAKGKGLGLADLLVQQLNRSGMIKNAPASNSVPAEKTQSTNTIEKTSSQVANNPDVSTQAIKAHTKSHAVHTAQVTQKFSSPADFVEKMWPHAQEAAQKLGVDATTLIAHAALETGWGKHIPCQGDGSSSFNLFGIKAGSKWNGGSVGANTLEFSDGVAVKRVERFKTYDSPADCFADYASLLATHPRYGETLNTGSNTSKFAQALQSGGYATDPHYATKLKAVARSVMSLVSGVAGNATTQFAGTTQGRVSRADT